MRTDAEWLGVAYAEALRSDDPRTQNGAVLVKDDVLVSSGANTFPPGIAVTPTRLDRDIKSAYMIHAEHAALVGVPIFLGATLYCPWYACLECARTILASRAVKRIVGHQQVRDHAARTSPHWTFSIGVALELLTEGGIACEWFDGPVDALPVLVGGETFDPSARMAA